jgi:hypothetical protein
MDKVAKVTVHAIFDLELPVRRIPVLVNPGSDIQLAFR